VKWATLPRGTHLTTNLPRAFVVSSVLGIAWGLAHVAMETLMGDPPFKIGLPLTLLWAAVLMLAIRRPVGADGGATLAAIVLGAVGCYWMAIMHLKATDWIGAVPWMHDPDGAGPLWVVPYNLLVYAGMLIGVTVLWTSMRVVAVRVEVPDTWFAFALSSVLLVGSMAGGLRYGGSAFVSGHRLIAAGVVPLLVMLVAAGFPWRIRSSMPWRRDMLL
jgi:hypothetical protein